MSIINVFRQDPFSAIELTSQVERIPFLPSALGDMNLFDPNPIRTTALAIEERDGVLSVIQTSQRGAPIADERQTERRKMRYFEVPRLVKGDTIFASELQNIREFGEETVLMQLQTEALRRLAGPTGLVNQIGYTLENQRLGAVQGLLTDADGSVLYNWFDEFEIAVPEEIAFNLAANVEYSLRPICNRLTRSIARSAKGAFNNSSSIMAICGDDFYDKFTTHVDVEKTYKNWAEAAELRDGKPFGTFYFGGIGWQNYRGSDDNTSIKIPDDKVKFFPKDAPGVFEVAQAPGETFEWINTPGKELYVLPIIDEQRKMWFRQEVYSYPLPICKRPETLRTGRMGA